MTTTTAVQHLAITTPSPWLRRIATARVRALIGTTRRATVRHGRATVIAPLTIGALDHAALTIRTCDRCRPAFNPAIQTAQLTAAVAGTRLELLIGLCSWHMRVELPDLDRMQGVRR
ncbi:hypothetical protein [Demequina silvatica]|uniref:hypothetical protein n=1 Tax=Demequina silvatica TaxID=1638988 RepID=UPI000783CF4C|nr:hypothetical protein [Demequina silvatica]